MVIKLDRNIMPSINKNQNTGRGYDPKSTSKKRFGPKNLGVLLIFVLLVCGMGFLGYKYIDTKKDYQDAQNTVNRLSNPEEAVKQEAENLKNRVSQLVEVPAGQEPTIATVQDVSKLQSQVFFKNAQNGDKVLIYTEAKKAILYRPSTDKIIGVTEVNIGDAQTNNDNALKTNDSKKSQ